jgi:hypothetical protein
MLYTINYNDSNANSIILPNDCSLSLELADSLVINDFTTVNKQAASLFNDLAMWNKPKASISVAITFNSFGAVFN